nr:hypothetical protein [Pseudomonas syringae]
MRSLDTSRHAYSHRQDRILLQSLCHWRGRQSVAASTAKPG